MNGTAHFKADYASLLVYFLLAAVEIALGMLVSALTESQVIAAVGTFCLLLALYLWDGLVGLLPTSAIGSLAGIFVVLVFICLLLNALSGSWKLAVGTLVLGTAVILGFYIKKSSAFADLLPKALGSFSLLNAFNSFATDHGTAQRGLRRAADSLCGLQGQLRQGLFPGHGFVDNKIIPVAAHQAFELGGQLCPVIF